jgi:hypothetical protein
MLRSFCVRRRVVIGFFLPLLASLLVSSVSEAATVAELLAQARQAHVRAREIKSQGWGVEEKQRVIQALGPIALSFLSASDLAQAASTQRAQVRDLYETLSNPLDEIYDGSIA